MFASAADFGGEGQQYLLARLVHFVEHHGFRYGGTPHGCQHVLHFLGDSLIRVHHDQHGVRLTGGSVGGLHHRFFKPGAGAEDPRRIHEDELGVPFGSDAEDAVARRLHLRRDDRHPSAYHMVDEGRFAGIGRADHRDETAAIRFGVEAGRHNILA